MRSGTAVSLVAVLVSGCTAETSETAPPPEGPLVVHLGEIVDESGEGSITLAIEPARTTPVEIHLDGAPRVVEIDVQGPNATLDADGAEVLPAAEPTPAGAWFRPRPVSAEVVTLEPAGGSTSVTIYARGAPVPPAVRERSLVWTDGAIVDDPALVGLGRVMGAAAEDGHGGLMLDRWFRRFATTLHSERAAPAQLMDELAVTFGADPSQWDLDLLPFKVTGVHNRLDLATHSGGCGELRVSIASTHPVYAPLHMLFLFRQEPAADDVAPGGEVHCLGTARRWSRLASLEHDAFVIAAGQWLDSTLKHESFLLAETVELTVSPWEWRQWAPTGDDALDNPSLFQTVATPALNEPGPLRDQFLAFVTENAAGLADRTVVIPATFRAQSARVPPSAPAERLSLDGLAPSVLAAYPALAESIEIVGCPTCHTTNASFVQTNVDRTFSPFYDKELDARAARLDALHTGVPAPIPPFGPLQSLD